MPLVTPLTFQQLSVLIQSTLQNSSTLNYVADRCIVLTDGHEQIPVYDNYLIKIMAPDSGYLSKKPKIGVYFRNYYTVAIELWIKSGSTVINRISIGNLSQSQGIHKFFSDVSVVLEHNLLNNTLDPYPGSNIGDPVLLKSDGKLEVGLGFLWFGNQDNIN